MAVIVKRVSESPTVQRAVRTVTVTSGGRGAPGIDGQDGADGDPGPPNTLAIGTVTTGAPGSDADATITGTAPSQTLNLTIPRGDTGAGASVADLDDVPDSATRLAMTPAERTAIANAPTTYAPIAAGVPAGGFFLDTLIKQSNVDYDVAWQNLPALLASILPPNSWLQYAAVCPPGNINLASVFSTLDGVSFAAAAALYTSGTPLVLLRNQTNPAQNGLYTWFGDIELLTRSASADESLELTGAVVLVVLGTDAGNIYKQTTPAPVIDTDPVAWELVGDAPAPVVGLPSLPAIDSAKTGVYEFASGIAQAGAIDTWTPTYGGLGDLTSEAGHKPDGSDVGPLFAGGDILVSASGKAIATGNMTLGFIWTPQATGGGVDTLLMAGDALSPEAAYYVQASESPTGDQNLALVAFHAGQLSLIYNGVRRGHTHSIVYVFSTTSGRKVYIDGRLAESNPAHTGVPTLANGTYLQIGNNKPFYTQPLRNYLSAVAQYDGALAGDDLQTLIDWLEDKRSAVQAKLLQDELAWNGPRLAMIGHSYVRMMRYDAEDYFYGLRQGAEVPAIGMGGVDAQTTGDMAARAAAFATRYHDARYIVSINGTNDLWNNHSLAMMQSNTATLIANLLSAAPRAQVILSTIPPFGGAAWDSPAYRVVADGYNAWVVTQGYPILDLDALLRNPAAPTQLLGAYDSGDHVHPNAAGFRAIMRALDALLPYAQTPVLDAHEAASDPHPQYTTAAEASAAIAAHEAASDPHPQYTTAAEAGGLITAHEAASDPHPGYLTAAEGSAAYAALSHDHASSAITDFGEAVQDQIGTHVKAGSGISVSYDDGTGDTTVSASGGGSSAIAFADHIVF